MTAVGGIMEMQNFNDLPATKGDIQMLLDAILGINDFGIETPEDPALLSLSGSALIKLKRHQKGNRNWPVGHSH
jgi:hypothetical protein